MNKSYKTKSVNDQQILAKFLAVGSWLSDLVVSSLDLQAEGYGNFFSLNDHSTLQVNEHTSKRETVSENSKLNILAFFSKGHS